MTSRDHMPGYPAARDDEHLRSMPRMPYPLGVPDRVKAKAKERMRKFADEVIRNAMPPLDPFTVTHMTQSDVPGVLIAAGAEHVVKALQRVADKGVSPEGMAAALRGRAVQEDERDIVDAVDEFMRQRERRVNHDRIDRWEQQAKIDMCTAQQSATQLHPQAGQVMQGFVTAEQIRRARLEQPQTMEQTKAEMQAYVEARHAGLVRQYDPNTCTWVHPDPAKR